MFDKQGINSFLYINLSIIIFKNIKNKVNNCNLKGKKILKDLFGIKNLQKYHKQ